MLSDCAITQGAGTDNLLTPKTAEGDLSSKLTSLKNLVVLQKKKDTRMSTVSVTKLVENFMTRSQSNVLSSLHEKKTATKAKAKRKESDSKKRLSVYRHDAVHQFATTYSQPNLFY